MKLLILALSVVALSVMNCKKGGMAPEAASTMTTFDKATSADEKKAGPMEYIIKPLGFNPNLPYTSPYINYLGSKGKTGGC